MITKKLALIGSSAMWITAMAISQASANLLTISGSSVTVTPEWVTAVSNSATALLTTVFEILKFLPVISLIIWGFFVLNKIFSIVKGAWSGGWK